METLTARCEECGRKLSGPLGGHRPGCNLDTSAPGFDPFANEEKTTADYEVVYKTGDAERTMTFEFSKTGVNQRTGTIVEQFARRQVAECTSGSGVFMSVVAK